MLALLLGVVSLRHGTAQQAYTPSIGDYGGLGLLQTRNARFGDDGTFAIGASFAYPYNRYFFSLQAIPGIEASYRYTTIQNRGFGFSGSRGEVEFQDKGADLKFELLPESRDFPAIALGLQDFIGTAQFAGEYIVASKRYYDFDFSVGLGWGRLGTRGHFKNPLIYLSDSFEDRDRRDRGDRGGTVNFGQFFAGEDVALFGGVEWLTPVHGLRLKVEYDPNDYQSEPLNNDLDVDFPLNFGVVYKPWNWLDMSVGLERGNTFMVRGALTPDLHTAAPVLRTDSPPIPVTPRTPAAEPVGTLPDVSGTAGAVAATDRLYDGLAGLGLDIQSVDLVDGATTVEVVRQDPSREADLTKAALVIAEAIPMPSGAIVLAERGADGIVQRRSVRREDLGLVLALGSDAFPRATGRSKEVDDAIAAAVAQALVVAEFDVNAVYVGARSVTVFVEQGKYRNVPQAYGRAARAVAAVAPPEFEEITVVHMREGMETSRVTILRADLERAVAHRGSPEEIYAHAILGSGDGIYPEGAFQPSDRYPAFDWSLTPQLRQHVGGADGLYLFQIWARLAADVELAPGLMVAGALGKNIYSQFDRLRSPPNRSNVPQVRSLIDKYLAAGKNNLVNLYASYTTNLATDWYAGVHAGIFEEMYAGVGGEVLYRPFNSRLAVGFNMFHVWQRDFDQRFDFLDYDTTTGHLSLYYDWPVYGLQSVVHIGRYLARDVGATFQLQREFDSGIIVGAFATKTNLSAQEFGEGSFDKGFFVSVPLDLFFLRPTRNRANFVFKPLTRDGGQMVVYPRPLMAVVGDEQEGKVFRDWSTLLD